MKELDDTCIRVCNATSLGSTTLPTTTPTVVARLCRQEAIDLLVAVTQREAVFGNPGQSEAEWET